MRTVDHTFVCRTNVWDAEAFKAAVEAAATKLQTEMAKATVHVDLESCRQTILDKWLSQMYVAGNA